LNLAVPTITAEVTERSAGFSPFGDAAVGRLQLEVVGRSDQDHPSFFGESRARLQEQHGHRRKHDQLSHHLSSC
jgi:hypothetical protein